MNPTAELPNLVELPDGVEYVTLIPNPLPDVLRKDEQ